MPKAVWEGTTIAESNRTVIIEGNHYFPPDAVSRQFLKPSSTVTTCPWKGKANYYTLQVEGKTNPDAAWYYPAPSKAAAQIKDHVAFWRGVKVET